MERLPYIHPDLTINESATKGRLVTATSAIQHGEVILKDAPHALVPALLVDEPPFLLCNRHDCSRRIPRHQISPTQSHLIRCSQRCLAEVVWCGDKCRSLDTRRHGFECLWLKKTAREIRSAYGDTEFVLMWLIIRILINRYLKDEEVVSSQPDGLETTQHPPACTLTNSTSNHQPTKWSGSHFNRRGWSAVWNLVGDPSFFKPDKVEHWRTMIRNFICNGILPLKYPVDEIANLICKVELNSFGLYPGVTGRYPAVSSESRGDYYGGGIYPTAAMFNHACCPNVRERLQ